MSDADRITVVGIVINATLLIVNMVLAVVLAKRTIQATLQAAHPAPKPKKKRYLTVTERRFLRNFRFIEGIMVLVVVTEPLSYLGLNPFPPVTTSDYVAAALSLGVMVMFTASIIAFEKTEVKQIKTGEFMKRLKRIAREQKLKKRS